MSTIEFNTYITDAEWEVMRVVWANDRVTSKKVISVLQEKMDWTQSTIKTILGRLVGKGVLPHHQQSTWPSLQDAFRPLQPRNC